MRRRSPNRDGHWQRVSVCFLVDLLLVWVAFLAGIWFRFGELSVAKLTAYAPSIVAASVALPAILYVGGLYSRHGTLGVGGCRQIRWVLLALIGTGLITLGMGSIDFSTRVGRGVFGIAMSALLLLVGARHGLLVIWRGRRRKTALCLLCGAEDEVVAELLVQLWGGSERLLGVVTRGGYEARSALPSAGTLVDLKPGGQWSQVDLLLARDRHFTDEEIGPILRELRYEGVEVVTLAEACEEAYHAVPIQFVSGSWLHRAASHFAVYYIRKIKRLFDIGAAASVLVALAPVFAVACLLVKLTSCGPLLYRQKRIGRMGRSITVTKLRTMRVDAEREGGAQWSSTSDPRVTRVGRWLRKFRIDEIPQLINVLRGDMSFVGPRPERPEFVEQLSKVVPHYRERLLIQPGLTGWAQVRYPYGSSVRDSVRKLEYDLYYLKHMGVMLDTFILLETIKVMVFGGVQESVPREFLEMHRRIEAMAPPGSLPASESAPASSSVYPAMSDRSTPGEDDKSATAA